MINVRNEWGKKALKIIFIIIDNTICDNNKNLKVTTFVVVAVA